MVLPADKLILIVPPALTPSLARAARNVLAPESALLVTFTVFCVPPPDEIVYDALNTVLATPSLTAMAFIVVAVVMVTVVPSVPVVAVGSVPFVV